ncbi:hypothetical protein CNMCM7691_004329 [Aspergillus felis]|uniref:Zn(2)-C6 fungal-type domain-containing protein n=1 Tax=Aspergillus felis TaxID=1287682 RepID=A0A8H6R529_9EURO|nr:hypothetical protein CNMCM7691_004329 [Aspergillus felis]
MENPSADKKRNKLGYHRTSVACVHCRRRKIRCLVAADDAQGRCENCIRLRKECQFFPVDQQPPVEKKSRPNSRLESASTDPSTTSSSPPTMGGGPDHSESFFPYQPMPLDASQDASGFHATSFPGNPMSSFVPGSTDFAAAPALEPSVPWDEYTTISDPQLLSAMAAGKPQMMNMPPNAWSPGPNNMVPMPPNAAMATTPTVPSQSQPISPVQAYTMQPDGSVWPVPQPPARSMTFPVQQEMASYPNPSQFGQQMHPDLKRRMTSPGQGYPGPPVNPQSPPPVELQATTVSMSYPGQPAAMGYPGWHDINSMPTMNVVQYPMYAADPTQQAAFGSPSGPMGHPGQGPPPTS